MVLIRQFVHRPNTVFLRKVLFQIHLWTGLFLGIYVVVISLSGAVLIFRNELDAALWTGPGRPASIRFLIWLTNLHFNLLAGLKGRTINGIGACLLVLLSATGATVWWPGLKIWQSRLMLRKRSNWKRLNWDLHAVIGFWSVLFVFMWGFTGAYLAFPHLFHLLIGWAAPLKQAGTEPSLGDLILRWLDYLHFGSFAGLPVKIIWAAAALAPPFLFITGLLMWWNRVIVPTVRKSRREAHRAEPAGIPEKQIVV